MSTAPLLTAAELGAKLGLSAAFIRSHSRADRGPQIPGYKIGRLWRYDEQKVRAWLEEQRRAEADRRGMR